MSDKLCGDDSANLSQLTDSEFNLSSAVNVPIDSLQLNGSPRLAGQEQSHVLALAELEQKLPPIVVHRSTMRVVDGLHRVHAAALRGCEEIQARFWDGDEASAFVFSVKVNVVHGLPLAVRDRTAAATRIILYYPHWSDRMIGGIAGLSSATVAAIRRCSTAQNGQSNARVGRDGRVRPLNSADGRKLASELLEAHPEMSLREIAKLSGIAPSTVRNVRERMHTGKDPVPANQQRTSAESDRKQCSGSEKRRTTSERIDRVSTLKTLRNDPSLRFKEEGRSLLRWLDQLPPDMERIMEHAPSHWVEFLAPLVRENAKAWVEFADRLESHTGERAKAWEA